MAHIHFETMTGKPAVFALTEQLIAAAASRNRIGEETRTTLGVDLADLAPLTTAIGLVTSADVVRDPRFPLRELENRAPNLAWIHITGAGIESLLPMDWLPRGVVLTNNSGVHQRKTGEFAAMALLMLNSQVPRMSTNQRAGRWEQIFTPSIAGKTLAVIGVGQMGSAAAREGKRLGMSVLGVRRSGRPHRYADEMFGPDGIGTALSRADFIYLSAPLTRETRHLVDRNVLSKVKPGAGLASIARAGVIDHEALRDALAAGALSGAVVDSFSPEPLPPESPMWAVPNLLVVPHCSSDDLRNYIPLTLDLVFDNLSRLSRGKPLRNRVDPALGY